MRMSAVALWGTLLCGTGLSLGGVARLRPMMVLIGACLVLPFLFYVIHTNLWYAGWLAAIGNFGAAGASHKGRAKIAWLLMSPLMAVLVVTTFVLFQSIMRMQSYGH